MYDSLINVNGNQVPTLEILLLLTIVALLPSLIIMMTSFSRTVIILSFLRNALGIQQTPPNMVLVGDFLVFDIVHYGSGDQGNQYGSI